MKKFCNWLIDVLPTAWGILWMTIISIGSVAVLILVSKWLLSVMGVM